MELIDENLYLEASRKRLVQDRVYESIGRNGNITVLGGPSVGEVYKRLRSIVGKQGTFTSFEKIDWIYAIQKLWYNSLEDSEQEKVFLKEGDIIDALPTDIMEIDLEHGIIAEYKLIKELFVKQRDSTITENKAFIFHTTLRGKNNGLENVIGYLNDLLGTEISFLSDVPIYNSQKEIMGRKYNIKGKLKNYSVEFYTYRDNAPMACVLIQY